MKNCERDEHGFGVLGIRGKRGTFFLSATAQKADSGSFFCTMFINFVIRKDFGCFP